MISSSAALALNHLLDQQPWACERLAAHAGSRIEFRSPPLPAVRLAILPSGRVSASAEAACDLIVTLSPFAAPLLLARSADALSHVAFSGPEALAGTVRGLLIDLRWDFEEDLARLVGDTAAHRMASAGRGAFEWQRDAAERLVRNFTEYWTEERPLLARRVDVDAFASDLQALAARVERLEGRLGGSAAAAPGAPVK